MAIQPGESLVSCGVLPSLEQALKHPFKGAQLRWPKSRNSKVLEMIAGAETGSAADCCTQELTTEQTTF